MLDCNYTAQAYARGLTAELWQQFGKECSLWWLWKTAAMIPCLWRGRWQIKVQKTLEQLLRLQCTPLPT